MILDFDKMYNWILEFTNFLLYEVRSLEKYDRFLQNFHQKFNTSEKQMIIKFMNEDGVFNQNYNLTEFEKKLLKYNLNKMDGASDKDLIEISEKIKSKKEEDNEKGYEKFIENFLDIKIFKLFGKNITLYSKKDVENSNILKRIIKLMTHRLKNEFNVINNLMYIFDMKSSKDSIALKLYGCLYVGVLIFGYILYLFLNEIMIMWILFVFFIISEYINVLLKEKNSEWNKNNESSFLMFFFITVIYVYAMFFKFELVYQYMILNLVIFFKTIAISRLRYKRLKNFSKKVLDVFVLQK